MDSVLFGHFRLINEADNKTKVFVVCKKKEEVRSKIIYFIVG